MRLKIRLKDASTLTSSSGPSKPGSDDQRGLFLVLPAYGSKSGLQEFPSVTDKSRGLQGFPSVTDTGRNRGRENETFRRDGTGAEMDEVVDATWRRALERGRATSTSDREQGWRATERDWAASRGLRTTNPITRLRAGRGATDCCMEHVQLHSPPQTHPHPRRATPSPRRRPRPLT